MKQIRDALNAHGWAVRSITPLGGGMVNRAARLETPEGPLFIKWNDKAPPGIFEAEAAGLRALAATQTLRVPHVLAVASAEDNSPAFLLLEWIETAPPAPNFARRFAEDLAALHRAPVEATFGWPSNNFLGTLPQINTPHTNWTAFYRECRLLPQIEIARSKGVMPPRRAHLLDCVLNQLETLLGNFTPHPVLLHGDLWSGNFLSTGQKPVVIDPAVYRGEREMEIAFIEMFGGFPPGFVELYRQIYPLQHGYEVRRPLHQLYPLLVHLNHFGESYGADLERACNTALSALNTL